MEHDTTARPDVEVVTAASTAEVRRRLLDPTLLENLDAQVVSRRRETELVIAALAAGRHIVLEGPPGTGKSTLLRAVARAAGLGFQFVEGNAELTPSRLVGQFDPALVLAEGYHADVFVDGPLVTALRRGELFYVEELNRVPEETLNTLITVMSEGELHVPRLGRVTAAPGFRLVAAMNPFDAVGTARISSAVYDRTCRLVVDYQDAVAEARIASTVTGMEGHGWLERVVELVRRTRSHDEIRVGSSVRGAIDAVLVASSLARLRSDAPPDPGSEPVVRAVPPAVPPPRAVLLDAVLVALSGRIRLHEGTARTSEDILRELFDELFPLQGAAEDAPPGAAPCPPAPNGAGGAGDQGTGEQGKGPAPARRRG